MADIFVSYARGDKARAEALARIIEARGHSVWWDRQILPGETFFERIAREIGAARLVVVLWSESAVRSRWCREEAAAALEGDKYAPARLDSARPPLGFRQFETADLSGWDGRNSPPQLAEFLAEIEIRLNAAAAADWSI